MGTGYKNNTTHYHTLLENIPSVSSKYMIDNGYFGIPGNGRKGFSRNYVSDNPLANATEFYNYIANGGIEVMMPNNRGFFTKMKDGTIISFREVSSSDGSPAIDINIKESSNTGGIKQQKIHFINMKGWCIWIFTKITDLTKNF